MSGVSVKCIYQHVGGTRLIVGSHHSKTKIDRAEVARYTLSVSCSTDLDYCVAFVDWVSVFFEHVLRTLKTYKRFTLNFPVVSYYFACLLALVARTTIAATFTSYLNRSEASFEISRHDKVSGHFSDSFCVLRTKVFGKTVRILRTGLVSEKKVSAILGSSQSISESD